MAIDYGISSLDAGASDITYSGNEGPQDPRAMSDIDKIILQHWLQQGGSYGDDIPEEFKLEIIKIYGLDKMASAPDMAQGGIARLGYDRGGRIGFEEGGWDDRVSSAAEDFHSTDTAADFANLGGGGGGQDHDWSNDIGTQGPPRPTGDGPPRPPVITGGQSPFPHTRRVGITSNYMNPTFRKATIDFLKQRQLANRPPVTTGGASPFAYTRPNRLETWQGMFGDDVEPVAEIKEPFLKAQSWYSDPLKLTQGLVSTALGKDAVEKMQAFSDLKQKVPKGSLTIGKYLDMSAKGEIPSIIADDMNEQVLEAIKKGGGFGETFQKDWSSGVVEPTFKSGKLDIDVEELNPSEMVKPPKHYLEVAEGGIARLGYANGQLVQPGLGRPGYRGDSWDDMGDWAMDQSPDIPDDTGSEGAGTHGSGTGSNEGAGSGGGGEDDIGAVGVKGYEHGIKEDQREEVAKKIAKESKEYKKKKESTFLEDRTKAMFNASLLIPGQTKRTKKYRKAYSDYLKSMGITPPTSLDDEDLSNFWVNDAFSYEPGAADAGMPEAMDYGDFLLEKFNNPTVKYRGDLGSYKREMGLDGEGQARELLKYPYPQDVHPGTGEEVVPDTGAGWDVASSSPLYNRSGPTHDFSSQYFYGADGGRIPAAYGGIMGNDGRRAYGLGSIFKKAFKAVKKVAKSPIGKMALMVGLGGLGGFGPAAGLKGSALGKYLVGTGLPTGVRGGPSTGLLGKALLQGGKGWSMANLSPWKAIGGLSALGGGITAMTGDKDKDEEYKKWLNKKNYWASRFGGDWNVTPGDPLYQRNLMTAADGGRIGYRYGKNYKSNQGSNEMKFNMDAYIKYLKEMGASDEEIFEIIIQGKDISNQYKILNELEGKGERIFEGERKAEPFYPHKFEDLKPIAEPFYPHKFEDLKPELARAQGGRIGYQDGNKVLPHKTAYLQELNRLYGIAPKRKAAQEGGLMDLGGMEKDYRNDGGFVPIGGQERADDVPARLSKNEFVFTADAVRAAGGGDIDKGAEVMENVMENLEEGGEISQQSQGLEGARDMFATSQRLEGVL